MQSSYAVVLITVPNVDEGEKISRLLLDRRLAACVNTIPGLDSHFWWQGKLDFASELLLVVKTKSALVDEITRTVKEAHSYSVPEVIALPIIGGNQEYLDWIEESVSGKPA